LRRACAIGAAAIVLVPAGCGGDDDGKQSTAPAASSPQVELRVVARDRAGRGTSVSFRCDGARQIEQGYRDVDAATLCRTALGLEGFLAGKPDTTRACTQVYGGPERAHITGTIAGRRIDRRFSRTDGCRISDWDRAQTLIPIRVD
jgi:hypothetical protein